MHISLIPMDHLEQHVVLKIQELVEKLHKLDCTLLGNKNDAWVMELMFEPGFHRYNLIHWILSKFGYDVETKHSTENKIKKLKSILSEWGICQEDRVIEGTAVVKEQLQFWNSLVDIIWKKHEITSSISMGDSDDGLFFSPEKCINKHISREFEEVCSSIHKLVESGNLQHIFKSDLQLAPDVESEVKNICSSKLEMLQTPKSQRLNEIIKENNKRAAALDIYKKLCESSLAVEDNEDDSEIELNKLEEEMLKVSTDLQTISQGAFKDVYEDLKLFILNAKADDFVDVGPAFQNVEPLLKDFLKLNKSFPKLESANLTFSQVNSELKDLLSQDVFFDENYTNTFKLLQEKN